MSRLLVRNTSTAQPSATTAPMNVHGQPFRFELLFNAFTDRGYADSVTDVLTFLIPGYDQFTGGQRLAARLAHAVRMQTMVQARLNYDLDMVSTCTIEQQVVLQSSRATPPDVTVWDAPVPLLLVDLFYRPFGSTRPPVSAVADVAKPPNIWWLRPSDEFAYLQSLAEAGVIALSMHADYR